MRSLILVAVLAAGCHRAAAPVVGPPIPTEAPVAAASPLEQLYRARQDSARQRFTPADGGFRAGMIGHPAQALAMANLAAANAGDASIRTLAARIHNAQTDEIALMQQWLRRRDQPVPALHADGWRVIVHGDHDAGHAAHGAMPGMLSDAQLDALAAARGAAFDRLFLSSMIAHHEGAVAMVDQLFATDGAAQDEPVFKYAPDVQEDQRTELARMRLMLAALGDTHPPQRP